MLFINSTRNTTLANKGNIANTFLTRLVGLLGKSKMEKGEGLLIQPCSSVHTFFMRFPIDIVYIDKNNKVTKIVKNLKPFRASFGTINTNAVIELPVGIIDETNTSKGDVIVIKN